MNTADKSIARYAAAGLRRKRELDNRDELGRITERNENPLSGWMEPKRRYGQVTRGGKARMTVSAIYLPTRALAALRTIADRRGVSVNYLICESLAPILNPLLTDDSPGLTDRPISVAPPSRVHPKEPPQVRRPGVLTDRR